MIALDRFLGKKIGETSHRIHRYLDGCFVEHHIRGQAVRILGFIDRESQERDVYQRDIEEEFHIRRSSVTSVLQNLEKNGFITRESVQSDARLKKIVLTEKAKMLQCKAISGILHFEEELLDLFDPQEQEQFFEYLNRISNYLDQQKEEHV